MHSLFSHFCAFVLKLFFHSIFFKDSPESLYLMHVMDCVFKHRLFFNTFALWTFIYFSISSSISFCFSAQFFVFFGWECFLFSLVLPFPLFHSTMVYIYIGFWLFTPTMTQVYDLYQILSPTCCLFFVVLPSVSFWHYYFSHFFTYSPCVAVSICILIRHRFFNFFIYSPYVAVSICITIFCSTFPFFVIVNIPWTLAMALGVCDRAKKKDCNGKSCR